MLRSTSLNFAKVISPSGISLIVTAPGAILSLVIALSARLLAIILSMAMRNNPVVITLIYRFVLTGDYSGLVGQTTSSKFEYVSVILRNAWRYGCHANLISSGTSAPCVQSLDF